VSVVVVLLEELLPVDAASSAVAVPQAAAIGRTAVSIRAATVLRIFTGGLISDRWESVGSQVAGAGSRIPGHGL
jgi:hypothetical protein